MHHILLVPSWYPRADNELGGIFFRDQAHALRDHGHRVGIIAPDVAGRKKRRKSSLPTPGISLDDDGGIPTYRDLALPWLPSFPSRNARGWLSTGLRLFEAHIRDNGMPDLVHAHSVLHGGMLADRIKKRYGLPFAITEHRSTFATEELQPWARRWAESAFAHADARLVVGHHLGALLGEQFPSAFHSWEVIPNTLDRRFEAPRLNPLATGGERFTFLNIAKFVAIKAQADLVAAFAAAFRGDPAACLRLAGDGPLRDRCQSLVDDLGVAGQVEFLGALDRDAVRREMLAADAFVLSSRYETFGVVLIEALACGTPVVATDCGGPADIVDDSNGILVPPGDLPAMAEALAAMRRTRGRYEAQILHAACLARYGQAAVAARLTAVYDAILGSDRADRPLDAIRPNCGD